MTLKTEMPISYEYRVHRVYHQHYHHHHYHLHHTLDHHHLHIHNQSIQREPIVSHQDPYYNHQQLQSPQLTGGGETSAPLAIRNTPTSIGEHGEQSGSRSLQTAEEDNYSPMRDVTGGHKMLQASGLTHLIARHNQRQQRILAASHGQQSRSAVKTKQRSQIQFLLLSALAYILSPIDLIPEAIFGIFGILDDLVFLFMCLFCVAIVLLYPLFREVRRTMFEKLGFGQKREITENKIN